MKKLFLVVLLLAMPLMAIDLHREYLTKLNYTLKCKNSANEGLLFYIFDNDYTTVSGKCYMTFLTDITISKTEITTPKAIGFAYECDVGFETNLRESYRDIFVKNILKVQKERKHNPSAFYANVYRDTMLELFQSGECKLFDDDLNDVTNKVLESGSLLEE